MLDLEKRIINSRLGSVQDIDEDEFLYRLEMRVQHSKDNRSIMASSFMMIAVVLVLTITQYGASNRSESTYFVEDIENVLETDLWNLNGDYLNNYDSYLNDMAYYLLQEGYVWETYDLLYVFEQEKEI
ncbi:MAG: hypothetical protein CMG06_01680 [Candidatus Marinimicrobia bacterium]|nr:hypothetical protein [Candidatus Neomarinimicrobiota bacterium]|tara:strand:+ start:4729 stop:5112 length:384 start_codon:yes stop_codon:yes gene_type:complete